MSSTTQRENYYREETPSGVWILLSLDRPDSPAHFVGPADRCDWDNVNFREIGYTENHNEDFDEADSRENDGEDVYEAGSREHYNGYVDEAGLRENYNEVVDEAGSKESYNENIVGTVSRDINNEEVSNGLNAAAEVVEAPVTYPPGLYYYPITGEAPIPAVYHHDLREELIRAADLKGTYSYKQPRGEDFTDVTSFLEEQREWGTTRANYPWIVFEYHRLDRQDPFYPIEHWYHNGKIVLDCENQPLKNLRNIPDVLSSEYPGCFMEANRRQDSRIKDRDFAARMPPILAEIKPDGDGDGNGNGVPTTIGPTLKFPKSANTLSCRRRRFRQKAGCLTWGPKPCPGMMKFLDQHLPKELKDRNTTYGFRDLTNEETVMVRAMGKEA